MAVDKKKVIHMIFTSLFLLITITFSTAPVFAQQIIEKPNVILRAAALDEADKINQELDEIEASNNIKSTKITKEDAKEEIKYSIFCGILFIIGYIASIPVLKNMQEQTSKNESLTRIVNVWRNVISVITGLAAGTYLGYAISIFINFYGA